MKGDNLKRKGATSSQVKISIIGSGVIGEATGIGLQMYGNEVIFHDIKKEKLTLLKEKGYKIAGNIVEAISNSTVFFICVQTPTIDGQMNLNYVEAAAMGVARALQGRDGYHVVVVRSTVLPFVTRTRIIPLLERHSGLKAAKDFGVCINPEFARQSTALNDFLNPSRIVIGELDKRSGDLLESLYASFKAPIIRTNLETAEMIKYVANCFLATKISFFNEVFGICKKLGLDPHLISEVVSLDPRIGKYGIYGGRPFKGTCLPKDLEAFINFVKNKRLNPEILSATFVVNEEINSA
jgi:UDPglucose 6-dehydrogenase